MRPRHRLVFPALALLLACSGGSSPKGILQSVRAAFSPQTPPPDTIPEMLDYAPDLQVNLADMARSLTYNASPIVMAAGFYLVLLWPLVRLLSLAERRIGHS